MKNYLYIFIISLVSLQVNAQQEINTDFRNQTLQVYQNLDKNRVPHGILLDFGMEFTNLRAFNGVLADSTLTTSQTLSDTYKTLLMCRVRNVNDGFISPVDYANRWYNQREEGVITLSGQYFRYSRFDDNAFPNRINYTNNTFSDRFVNGVWQNPYQDQSMFAMAPSVSIYKGLNLKVKLPQNLMLSNYANTIQQIHIDFGDGLGFRLVNYNTQINVNYNQPNTYTWRYRLTLTNGQTIQSHSRVVIEEGLNAIDYDVYKNQTTSQNQTLSNPLNQYFKKRITATIPIFGRLGTATVYVKFRLGGTNIQNPLIVAEGFDPGVILSREIEAGQNNLNGFIFNFNSSQSQLPNELNSYDIIYVDWDNGVDFLQRNAMVFEEVIKWVNQEKASNGSTTKNVVLGQSMGGLIARYALRDIELNRNFNHDTRLYVSHDAPHLGANVPYSVQYSARHLRNLYIQTPVALLTGDVILPLILNFADGITTISNQYLGTNLGQFNYVTPLQAFSLADVPAARQMQYTWVSNNYAVNNTIHQAWMQEYSNLGFPQGYSNAPIRNISIANGSECGILQPDNGNIMSYIKDAGRDTFLSNYIGILDAVYGALLLRPDIIIVSLFPGKSYWEIDFQSRYMTTLNQNKQIYKGSIKYKKKVFWFIPVSITVTNRTANQPSNVLPFDIYGGGFERTSTTIPIAGSTLVSNAYGFIPTASALAIGSGTTVINDTDYRRSYVGGLPPVAPKNTQFHNFVTHFDSFNPNNNNTRHISFNRRNGNWLRSELNIGIPDEITNCSFLCNGSVISGPDEICTSGVFFVPQGATFYNWQIIQGGSIVSMSGNGTRQITLNRINNANGLVRIRITYGDNNFDRCGNATIEKEIWVGTLNFNSISNINPNLYPHLSPIAHDPINNCQTIGFEVKFWPLTQNVLEYQWVKVTQDVAWQRDYEPNDASNRAIIFPTCNKDFVFKVRARNACGWSQWFELTYAMNTCNNACPPPFSGIIGNNFILTPNPLTNSMLNVSIKPNAPWFPSLEVIPNPNEIGISPIDGGGGMNRPIRVNVTVANQMGVTVLNFPNTLMPANLNLSSLPSGTYLVIFEHLGQIESHTIIKQ
jgi:hypothetical protein